MIKVLCNLCSKDLEQTDFYCETVVQELVSPVIAKDVNMPKQPKKTVFHTCQGCYDKQVRPIYEPKKK